MKLILYFLLAFQLQMCSQTPTNQPNKPTMNTNNLPKTEQEWKEKLSPEQYYILREKGTERAFTGEFLSHNEQGIYTCAGCEAELFSDDMKFDSPCGWPSFDTELAGNKIVKTLDKSHGMVRTEITCAACGGHLGHLFDDGPTKTGQRYCVNSVSLGFKPEKDELETLVLGGGCFWCIEAVFQEVKGIKTIESGYAGGKTASPTYKDICTGTTHHAEVVKLTYNPNEISTEEILEIFFTVHDPTTLNRQGADVGTQYRSVVFYTTENQKNITKNIIQKLTDEKIYDKKIVTQVEKLPTFYKAEDYHQNYYKENTQQPYCQMVITPKIEKFRKVFQTKNKK